MQRKSGGIKQYINKIYWIVVAVFCGLLISVKSVYAETVWERFDYIMHDFYLKLLGITTIVAVVAAMIALIIRMTAKNQKAVDEASAWLKRIVITYIIINSLGFIIEYIQPLVSGGQYSG